MKNNIQISIPNPCSENWNAMQANTCGRFCNTCQKTVTDFTSMSDEAFISYFQNTKEVSCGRFTDRQLQLEIPAKSFSFLSFSKMTQYVAASMLAVAGLSGKVFGQKATTTQIINDASIQNNTPNPISEKYIDVTGVVFDETNSALPAAIVKIDGSHISTFTDADGKFTLQIPESYFKNGQLNLTFCSLNYETIQKTIHETDDYSKITIELNLAPVVNGGFAVTIKDSKWNRFKRWIKINFL